MRKISTSADQLSASPEVLAGISSGSAVWAATQLAKRPGNKGEIIAALLPEPGPFPFHPIVCGLKQLT